ncbi:MULTISPECIES: hypothetical protein [unclassified Burkholderia]|uniref:hypothetical protein n=1 Tax=unclassified Burkholderia TaxID=2613784 RepID=UPI001423320F|nr:MULTISPECIES: hypothetical protein [unclassified Burkholderia]NIE61264.1 hypothetical protein [Burkholderia sp. Ap-955]NIF13429.1 hypothetical protein [Burkholderia sp. Ax-1735]NIG06659.1 hypothetical protein [Burkholderia sp. Tr-849]
MLFHYEYVSTRLEKIEEWLSHLVKEVWCKPTKSFYLRRLLPEFQQVVRETVKSSRGTDYLFGPIHSIHNICRDKLTEADRTKLASYFDQNIDILALCCNQKGSIPATYDDIKLLNPDLAKHLYEFCVNLWSEVRKRKAVTDRLGTLSEYFREFSDKNRKRICPFCGISRLDGVFSSIQEDFDHYLPKGKYPFNSISTRNLAPICDKCNKKYKLQQDPIHNEQGGRRKAFYSYSKKDPRIQLKIKLTSIDGQPIDARNLQPGNIQLHLTSTTHQTEIESWKEIFHIEARYKAICCEEETAGYYWLQQVLGEMREAGKSPEEALTAIKRAAISKWADLNFLKIPFLDACHDSGLVRQ